MRKVWWELKKVHNHAHFSALYLPSDAYQGMYIYNMYILKIISAATIAHSYVKIHYIIPPNINEHLAQCVSFQCMYRAFSSILSILVIQKDFSIVLTCNTMLLSEHTYVGDYIFLKVMLLGSSLQLPVPVLGILLHLVARLLGT